MLSGNGRHRRPRQAPALLVAAGVTGSAIAIPLLGATGASAAGGTTWDKVAECETGGSWSESSGNGFYGGLQLSQDDWEKYGGLDFASSADQASRSQQIAVAEKILDDQGVGAFHTCGLTSGLADDSGSADVDTGVGGGSSSDTSDTSGSFGLSNSSGSTGSSGSSSSSGQDGASDADSASPSPSGSSGADSGDTDNSGNSNKSDTSSDSSSTPGTSEESGTPSTGATKGDDSDNYRQSVGSSALVDTGALGTGKHRGGSADDESDAEGSAASAGRHASRTDGAASDAQADTYTVRAGDTLASIADSLGVDGGWHRLYDENKQVIGSDPSHIVTGQTLRTGS